MYKLALHLITSITVAVILAACNVSKNSAQKEMDLPCSEVGRSDAHFFRVSSSAVSKDRAMAKEKALISSRQLLASLMGTQINAINKRYLSSANNAENQPKIEITESVSNESISQNLKGISIVCEKMIPQKDGSYLYYIAIEVPKSLVCENYFKQFGQNNDVQKLINTSSYKAIFEKELQQTEIK